MTRLIIIAAALLMATSVSAHEGHAGGEPSHGGMILESGHHRLEVVAKNGTLEVYVSDDAGKPEETAAATATAVILAGGKKSDVTLVPAEANVLRGTGDFIAGKGTMIVLTLTMPGHAPEQSRLKLD
jgi:hypothetical protein